MKQENNAAGFLHLLFKRQFKPFTSQEIKANLSYNLQYIYISHYKSSGCCPLLISFHQMFA